MRILWAVVRLLTGLAAIAAVVAQYVVNASFWRSIDVGVAGKTVDYVLYFTVDSNLAVAIVLIAGAVRLLRRRGTPGRGWATTRLAVTTYMVTTGVVYNLLLRDIPVDPRTALPWTTDVLHVMVPAVALLDWLLAPDRRPLGSGSIGRVVVFPLAWVAVVLLRGPFTGDEVTGAATYYPYPFLDPALGSNGYLSVALWVLVIAAFVCGVSLLLAWASRRGSRQVPPA